MDDFSEFTNIVVDQSLTEYFVDSLREAIARQGARVTEVSEHYLVNLLTNYVNTDQLFDTEDGKVQEKALAVLLMEAMDSNPDGRIKIYKNLGDYALYISGFFSDSLTRKLVDVDYYITMGESAYDRLASILRVRPQGESFYELFADLSSNFPIFVDLLAEVSDRCFSHTNRDLLRIYEKWIRTRSRRDENFLAELGILANPNADIPFLQ